ncbi:D-glycero-D-manno-heptose 1-phosphate guanosyltransferase, partial [Campylobacter jejuni]|nr:D-glycero-D-manno-heptose 1-phosphate guanosyltransferase [Campylobacter jejuni]
IGVPEDYKKYLELNTKEKYVILER